MRYRVGARVHYRVYPSGMPQTTVTGTVVDVGRNATKPGRLLYVVQWDDIDYSRFTPSNYEYRDLCPIACDACGADAGESCRWHCVARPDDTPCSS